MRINKKLISTNLASIIIISLVLTAGATYAISSWSSGNVAISGDTMCFDINYEKGQDINFNSGMTASLSFDEANAVSTSITLSRQNNCYLYGIGTISVNINSTANLPSGGLKYRITNNMNSNIINGSINKTGTTNIYTDFDVIDKTTYTIYFWLDANYIDNSYLSTTFSGTISGTVRSAPEYGPIEDSDNSGGNSGDDSGGNSGDTTSGVVNSPLGPQLTTISSQLSSTIDGGLYRYQGNNSTITENYICFGTNELSTCTSAPGTYMYRIIGVTSDGLIKVIKKEAIDTAQRWDNQDEDEVSWPRSDVYSYLTGTFLGTINSTWQAKIVDYSWKYTGFEDILISTSASTIYNYENNSRYSQISKVALMYLHDYFYAYSTSGPGNATNAKNSWIHLSNNDSSPPSSHEWTMSQNTGHTDPYIWGISSNGAILDSILADENEYLARNSMRPVFYIKNTETYKSGDGTITNPYIIN